MNKDVILDIILDEILTPMNHRETDYIAQRLSGCDIPGVFACSEMLEWIDETAERVFDDDLIMDYGIDCLRLYLMFEATPRENDAPFYESWHESALEGIYKFLSRYRRLVLVAVYRNEHISADAVKSAKSAIDETKNKIEKYISRGNELSNRHNIVSALMELQKTLQNELKINETAAALHKQNPETSKTCIETENMEKNEEIVGICRQLIMITAQFAPNISKILWEKLNNL